MEPKQPTDHLPPAEERDENDQRTTHGDPFPGTGVDEPGRVSPATAAEPEKPARHGIDKLPPGVR